MAYVYLLMSTLILPFITTLFRKMFRVLFILPFYVRLSNIALY